MCAFMNEVEQKTGCEIESLDVGGGFASKNALQGIYLPPEQVVPSFDQYAEEICTPLLEATYERVARGRPLPVLVLETASGCARKSKWAVLFFSDKFAINCKKNHFPF